MREAENRRRAFNNVGRPDTGGDIRYETKPRNEVADKRAKKAGKIEKLK